MIRVKTVAESKVIDADNGIYQVWITREVVDRSGDIVVAAGAKVDNYLKNPVVQWAHRYDQPPVAKAFDLEVHPGIGIVSNFQFPVFGDSEAADVIHRLWRAGFINASSIGFNPIKSEKINPDDDDGFFWFRPPMKFLEWELLEFSLVPVPANQEALRRSMKYLMTADQRRREKRRINERQRNEPEFVEPAAVDSELVASLSSLSQQLKNLNGVLQNGSAN